MSEKKTLLKHALTVLLGQLAVISFGVTDTIVAGRYDPNALAALSISSAIYISVYVALLGVLQAMLPMLAELHGAKSLQKIGDLFHQGLYLLFGLCFVGLTVLLSPQFILKWTQVPDKLHQSVCDYLFLLAIALPAALFFRLFSTLNQSLGHPTTVTLIQLIALAIKIPLSILLTFGFADMEPQGLQGCAVATILVNYAMLSISVYLLKYKELYQDYGIWKKPLPPNFKDIGLIARSGVPNALSVTVEVTSFTFMALLIARLGVTASASHQVAANLAALLYMVPLSFGIATSARTSYWLGAHNFAMVKNSVKAGFQLLLLISFLLSTLLWLARDEISHIYVSDPEVMRITSELIGLLAFYHFSDAVQTICFFVLRSLKVVLIPFFIYSLLLWGIGLGGGLILAYHKDIVYFQSPSAFWLSSIAALCFVSASLLILLRLKLNRFGS